MEQAISGCGKELQVPNCSEDWSSVSNGLEFEILNLSGAGNFELV
jgi:hypothetical protein